MTWEKLESLRVEAGKLSERTFDPDAFFKLQEAQAAITSLLKELMKKN